MGRFGIPREFRPDIHAIYAFARTADDFADEPEWEGKRLEKLGEWRENLESCLSGAREPVFVALADTIRRRSLPLQPFRDLLSAFEQDAAGTRYETWEQVLDYCRRSADPIGRLVLAVTGQGSPESLPLSDALCTALQLTNFWQDLSVDLPRGRCYLPREDAQRFGVDLAALARGEAGPEFAQLLELETERTVDLYEAARPLAGKLSRGLRIEIAATWLGGRWILDQTMELGEEAVKIRPALTLPVKLYVVAGALLKAARGGL